MDGAPTLGICLLKIVLSGASMIGVTTLGVERPGVATVLVQT